MPGLWRIVAPDGGGAIFPKPPGGGGSIPDPALPFVRLGPSEPSFFYHKNINFYINVSKHLQFISFTVILILILMVSPSLNPKSSSCLG